MAGAKFLGAVITHVAYVRCVVPCAPTNFKNEKPAFGNVDLIADLVFKLIFKKLMLILNIIAQVKVQKNPYVFIVLNSASCTDNSYHVIIFFLIFYDTGPPIQVVLIDL